MNRSRSGTMVDRVRAGTLALLAVATVVATGCHPGARRVSGLPARDEAVRAIWVTRWDFKTPQNIAQIMENCRSAGFNTVLFQVRGNGTVLYRSRIEPWAEEVGGRDPGFDPLAVACKEAHRRGLSLHAWANVMPGWRGESPPADRRQLYNAHPDWFWRDSRGRRQPLGWYNSINPCYPEVRRYLVSVMREIVESYPVDGLHLDYIRFPNEYHKSYAPLPVVPDYPRDPRTLALFHRATGQTPESSPKAWNDWRTQQVTQLVRDIRDMSRKRIPGLCLSAAVGASPQDAKRRHFQDAQRWIAENLLDAVFPMNYASNPQTFEKRLAAWSSLRRKLPVVTGVMLSDRKESAAVSQMARAVGNGVHVAAFAYNAMYERPDKGGRIGADRQSPSRASLRGRVAELLRRKSRPQM